MDRRDVLMVNQSLDRLGESLLRERMNKQAQSNFESQRADRRGEVEAQRADRREEFKTQSGLEERRTKAAEDNALTNREYRDRVLSDAKVKQGIAQVQGQVNQIAALHKSGQISTAEANRKMKLLQQTMRDSTELLIQESGLADYDFQDVPKKEPVPDAKEITIGNRKFAQTANGALIPTDKEPARPFTRTRTNPDDPNVKVTQRMTAEEYEAMEKSLKPGGKKPTRAQARQYVDKYGPKATEQLKADGFDVSGYAD